MNTAEGAWQKFMSQTGTITTIDAASATAILHSQEMTANISALDTALDNLNATIASGASGATADANSLMNLLPIVVGLGALLALVVGSVLAHYLTRKLVTGIKGVHDLLTSLSENCATRLADGLAAMASGELVGKIVVTL